MATYEIFKNFLEKAAEKFIGLDRRRTIRLISHADSDGICAASILIRTLNFLKFRYSVTIVNSLDSDTLDVLAKDDNEYFVFTDLGSGQLKSIVSKLPNKIIFILDHHLPQPAKINGNIFHINPLIFGLDGQVLSASGVMYLFCKCLTSKIKNMAHIAIVGAVGDKLDKKKFSELNREIIDDGKKSGKLKEIKGVRFFGRQMRPLHKLLEYSTDPYIPGITGNIKATFKFLESLDIPYKRGSSYRKIFNLTDDEMSRLIKGIIKKRKNEKNPKDIFGDIYILPKEEEGSPFYEVKEFSTVVNACAKMGKTSLGIGVCLNDKRSKEKSVELTKEYKKEIMNVIKWYEKNKNTDLITKGDGFIIINAGSAMPPSLAGTFASTLSYSSEAKTLDYIIVLAQNVDSTTKVSIRYSGKKTDDVNLRKIMKDVINEIKSGDSGGHKSAAGAVIPSDKEKLFIEVLQRILFDLAIEEKVN